LTWILVYQNQDYNGRSESKAKEVIKLIWWMVHEGQQNNEALSYGTLSPEAVKKSEAILKAITFGDKKILE
jgi:phosphate transport system substrate-binding protein